MSKEKIREMTRYALFIAIIFLLGLTPLGFIMLPFAAITTVHIPVIAGGYSFGVKGGAILGFFFGLVSLIRCFMSPDLTASIILGNGGGFGIYNLLMILVILFLPRILTGVFSALTYRALDKAGVDFKLSMGLGAAVGSLTNSVFYLGGLILMAYHQVAAAYALAEYTPWTLIGVVAAAVVVNVVCEAVAAVLICVPVGRALQKIKK